VSYDWIAQEIWMASLKEIALGITQVLQGSPNPEPLTIDLWNESTAEAASLIKFVIDECGDAGISLAMVTVDQKIAKGLDLPAHRGVLILGAPHLTDRIEFFRRAP
jgi:hypothetical protein